MYYFYSSTTNYTTYFQSNLGPDSFDLNEYDPLCFVQMN